MKRERQQAILRLISEYEIETQDELISRLNDDGYNVTQATISRDIRELKISKVLGAGGTYHYSLATRPETAQTNSSFKYAYSSAILSVESVGNIVVVKTHPGLAQAVAAGIDTIHCGDILGCVAGDDAIITVARDTEKAIESINKLRSEISGK